MPTATDETYWLRGTVSAGCSCVKCGGARLFVCRPTRRQVSRQVRLLVVFGCCASCCCRVVQRNCKTAGVVALKGVARWAGVSRLTKREGCVLCVPAVAIRGSCEVQQGQKLLSMLLHLQHPQPVRGAAG